MIGRDLFPAKSVHSPPVKADTIYLALLVLQSPSCAALHHHLRKKSATSAFSP